MGLGDGEASGTIRAISLVEDDGVLSKAVHIRRLGFGLTLHIGADIVGAQLIEHNDDEVHRGVLCRFNRSICTLKLTKNGPWVNSPQSDGSQQIRRKLAMKRDLF